MFSKIDKRILNTITALNDNNYIDVIIKYKDGRKMYDDLSYLNINSEIIDLSFISSVSCKVNFKDLYKLANFSNVKYITCSSKVTSLIFNSKKFINYNSIEYLLKVKSKHTCVIIDTGIYPHIDFLLGKNRIIKFIDIINYKENMYDDNGHGTFVAGVFCGGGIVDKYSGIDSNAHIIVIKALDKDGETTSVKILESMQWVINNKNKYNIKLVCMSFGSIVGEEKDPLMYGAEMLWDRGVVVVSAAGNNGPEYSTIMSPGASSKIITVGSIDATKEGEVEVADFSSRGPAFNNYKPDVVVPGVDVVSTAIYKNGVFYTTMSGTSVSTPMVAGIVSLMFNHNLNYTPDQIKYMLLNSTIKITGDKNSEGFGIVDLSKLKLL